ncbi:hypothetical protein K1T71_002950 [Dendrolimus kikuchii]|uniref:Uncharacterized protein n=1 Tax=Dendrolimus kikuchii TaxID=765133 RepID=A0ACC1DAJ7_9NEOP|nr:hypothetical protein K1T71_002950 [Dendrolimus kikuchii]
MSNDYRNNDEFAHYLQSVVRLEALEKITQDLDEELADSQKIMSEIKTLFDSIPNQNQPGTTDEAPRRQDVSNFMEVGVPKLLLKDMTQNTGEVDLDDVISAMKKYAEDLKKNFVQIEPQPQLASIIVPKREMEGLDLQQYALSLDQLSKRLANIKLSKTSVDNKNDDLEAKLGQLCQDVNMFTQIVQVKTAIGESNQNWAPARQDHSALHYDNIINKLLSGINEVSCLLQNKN